MLSGAFWINKPAELTSSDVVVRLKIALTRNGYCEKGFKIGHGGTLDPFATGALVILVGEATKLADTYLHSNKAYSGIIHLGKRTDTADFTGTVIENRDVPALPESQWQSLAQSFVVNDYWQTPPMYSAKKQDGRALHTLARQGIEVERKAILKKIDEFTVKFAHSQDPTPDTSELSFLVRCESGTYVRVIAEDLAHQAGTVAHLRSLVREQSSDVTLSRCSDLETVLKLLETKTVMEQISAFHPMKEVSTHLRSLVVTESEAASMLQGQSRVVHSVVERFVTLLQAEACAPAFAPKYWMTRLENGFPTALFERTSEAGSILPPTYRLQRMILWES
jgi:tRNA pseudouridine55 synthase